MRGGGSDWVELIESCKPEGPREVGTSMSSEQRVKKKPRKNEERPLEEKVRMGLLCREVLVCREALVLLCT